MAQASILAPGTTQADSTAVTGAQLASVESFVNSKTGAY